MLADGSSARALPWKTNIAPASSVARSSERDCEPVASSDEHHASLPLDRTPHRLMSGQFNRQLPRARPPTY